MIRWLAGLIGFALAATSALAAEPALIGVGYLGVAATRSTLSLVEQPAENDGIAGARLAIEDNNTTGKFLGQRFVLEERRIREGGTSSRPRSRSRRRMASSSPTCPPMRC